MNIYAYFQSHDLFNSNATYLDNSIGHFIKMCKDSHLQHHELEEIHLNWFAVKHCLTKYMIRKVSWNSYGSLNLHSLFFGISSF